MMEDGSTIHTPEVARVIAAPIDVPPELADGPLGWLFARRDATGRPPISPAEFCAGAELARDLRQAGPPVLPGSDPDALDRPLRRRRATSDGGASGRLAGLIDARSRLAMARDAIGPELYALAADVCGREITLAAAEAARNWPQRSAKVVLRIALAALARHYRFIDGPE